MFLLLTIGCFTEEKKVETYAYVNADSFDQVVRFFELAFPRLVHYRNRFNESKTDYSKRTFQESCNPQSGNICQGRDV